MKPAEIAAQIGVGKSAVYDALREGRNAATAPLAAVYVSGLCPVISCCPVRPACRCCFVVFALTTERMRQCLDAQK
jgi:hypothetical protein